MSTTADTTQLQVYSIQNNNGLSMSVTNFGGRIITLKVPDKNGLSGDIVLGYDSLNQYFNRRSVYGAMIGRFANRIANGKFSLEGKEYQLATNNGPNAIHGGPKGFHNVFWQLEPFMRDQTQALEMTYVSKDGEEGYPGNLTVKVIYSITDLNELVIEYEATTDQTTIINLTQHSFFNLAGEGTGDILNHDLTLNAGSFTPVDDHLIPTGEIKSVVGTPFDFLKAHKIGERINQEDPQLKFGKGYDHNWVLNKNGDEFSLAATVHEPVSGRIMEVWTTEPGMQFYSGNFLNKSEIGKGNKVYDLRYGFCLETQHFPDSPNRKNFPAAVLKPGEVYKQRTVFKFSVEK